jgi:hypothetical protein
MNIYRYLAVVLAVVRYDKPREQHESEKIPFSHDVALLSTLCMHSIFTRHRDEYQVGLACPRLLSGPRQIGCCEDRYTFRASDTFSSSGLMLTYDMLLLEITHVFDLREDIWYYM